MSDYLEELRRIGSSISSEERALIVDSIIKKGFKEADRIMVAKSKGDKPIIVIEAKERNENLEALVMAVQNYLGEGEQCDVPLLVLQEYSRVELKSMIDFLKEHFSPEDLGKIAGEIAKETIKKRREEVVA